LLGRLVRLVVLRLVVVVEVVGISPRKLSQSKQQHGHCGDEGGFHPGHIDTPCVRL
jgi:hypothetical protein